MRNDLIHAVKRLLGKNTISKFYRALGFLSDESFIRLVYRLRMGHKLDLKNPRLMTEKLQWLKLNDHNPRYSRMVDKLAMRDFVQEKIGPGHTVPLLGVWNRFSEIDFESLPDRFVIKTTHDSGSYIICRDKSKLDKRHAEKVITRSLKRNYYKTTREWQYRSVVHRVLAEQYLEDINGHLTDYKFFCFNGEPLFLYVEAETAEHPVQTIVDPQFNPMPFLMEDPRADVFPEKPACFDNMLEYARKLSEGTPFLRVDIYCVENTIYVGELTFYHFGGFIPFNPPEWDLKFGEKLDLPGINQ